MNKIKKYFNRKFIISPDWNEFFDSMREALLEDKELKKNKDE